jgi:hypothetical protein
MTRTPWVLRPVSRISATFVRMIWPPSVMTMSSSFRQHQAQATTLAVALAGVDGDDALAAAVWHATR